LIACTSTSKTNSEEEELLEEDEENGAEVLYEDDVKPKTELPFIDEHGLSHPKKATAWQTRKMLMMSELPPPDRLRGCKTDVDAISQESRNKDDVIKATRTMKILVEQDPKFYHWCFYTYVTLVDQRLDSQGTTFDERSQFFIHSMRGLWILGRTLDAEWESDLYFRYLRARYVQLSRDYFGRNLEVLSDPLGDQIDKEKVSPAKGTKAAGKAPIDT